MQHPTTIMETSRRFPLKLYPPPLHAGNGIAIISPASTVRPDYVDHAAALLSECGYDPVVYPSAKGPACGSFAASHEVRLKDLHSALADDNIGAILCARGGYGCVHLLADPTLPDAVRKHPKWIVGFSDVSALHALWHSCGVVSLHAPMAKHLSCEGITHHASASLMRILSGDTAMLHKAEPHALNRCGKASGELRGGNFAVLNGLASTPFDMLHVREGEDVILFVEDISEAIYAVERMLMRLHLSGTLSRVRGLVIGQFTEYRPDRNFSCMEDMIHTLLTRCEVVGIPVAFNFPVGHVADNLPLVEGAYVELEVTPQYVTLKTVCHE